jgi:two-component system response regulator AtoC
LRSLSVDRSDDGELSYGALLTGKSLKGLAENLRKVAATPSTVLVLGESGSGKEFLAEEIHQLSDRAFQPLIKVNCAAVSSMALETELFGGQKPGRFELAHKGALFLDEISEINSEVQARLFDFLETGSFEHPLTGERRKADVRLIVSTRKDLAKEVREGRFREDLYYKLNVAPFTLPPLRERKDDLPELVGFFLKRLNKKLGRSFSGASQDCLDFFASAGWPGNLRQLEHVLERMMLLAEGAELKGKDITADIRGEIDRGAGPEGASFREIVRRQTQNLEKDLIEKALSEMDGNITRTAEHLGISRKGLQIKMKELGIR